MRPSLLLITMIMVATGLTTFTVLWLPLQSPILLALLWGGLLLLAAFDFMICMAQGRVSSEASLPDRGFVGHSAKLTLRFKADRGELPRRFSIVLDMDDDLKADETSSGTGATDIVSEDGAAEVTAALTLLLQRRGVFEVRTIWLKWPSTLRLLEVITRQQLDKTIKGVPDISPVLSGAIDTQLIPLESGQKEMFLRGDGSEFHQLREFVQGMDPRSIDWKRSARNRSLVARETRAERNHQVVLCVDRGRLMAEKIEGLPKLDRAINAALALCWAGGLAGDLVGFYNFDSRPRLFIPPAPGRSAFSRLQASCADLNYEASETNHTLGFSQLASRLKRRSLVVIFSDFVDTITAELMIENMSVLARHHFVIYVSLQDPVLSRIAHPSDLSMENIARSVAANQILDERRAVLDQIARLGILCLNTTPAAMTPELVARYVNIKSRELV